MGDALPETTSYDGAPYVGCAATEFFGSDCYPATVVWVSDGTVSVEGRELPKTIRISADDYRVVSGHGNDGSARYTYHGAYMGDPEACPRYSYRRRLGGYVREGIRSNSTAAQTLGLGRRRAYRDPSF